MTKQTRTRIPEGNARVNNVAIGVSHIMVPVELTAENGAKAALVGEFYEKITMYCPHCTEGMIDGDVCEECDGAGEYALGVAVSWPTIKEIWKKAIEVVGETE